MGGVAGLKKIKKKTVLAVGDSMVNSIEESKFSKMRHIWVQPIPGGKRRHATEPKGLVTWRSGNNYYPYRYQQCNNRYYKNDCR